MSRQLGRVLRTLRHTRPQQLVWRTWLTGKRSLLRAVMPRLGTGTEFVAASVPSCAPNPPLPIFPPRTEAIERRDNGLAVRFFEQSRALEVPIDWHPAGLTHNVRLWKMHLHLMEYLEALDDAAFERTVGDWIAHNRPYGPTYWLYDWNAFTVAIRCVVWMQQLASRGTRVSDRVRTRMLASLAAQMRFLDANLERDLGGNHLIKDIKALLWAGAFFQGREAERWTRRGMRLLRPELAEQILPDGMNYERSAAYHAQVFADLLECRSVLRDGPLRSSLTEVLQRMTPALADLTHPDGGPSLFNDSGLHSAYSSAECLAAWREIGGTTASQRAEFALPDAGYFGVRAGDSLVLVDCGPIGPDHLPAHGHGDILAFEWSLRGVRMIVDAGVFEYALGPRRDESRSTRVHNTVTVADADQCEFWDSFRVGRRARVTLLGLELRPGELILEGTHDGFHVLDGAPEHRRRIVATPTRIEVADVVMGGAGQPVVARLLLHPECRVTRVPGGLDLARGDVRALLETEADVRIDTAAFCPDFGVRLETSQIVLTYGSAPCRGGFVLTAR